MERRGVSQKIMCLVSSPASGEKLGVTFLGLTKGNHKALPGIPHWESCPPDTRFGAQPMYCNVNEVIVKDSGSPGWPGSKAYLHSLILPQVHKTTGAFV